MHAKEQSVTLTWRLRLALEPRLFSVIKLMQAMNTCKCSWLITVTCNVTKPGNAFLTLPALSAMCQIVISARCPFKPEAQSSLCTDDPDGMVPVMIQTGLYVCLSHAFVIEVPAVFVFMFSFASTPLLFCFCFLCLPSASHSLFPFPILPDCASSNLQACVQIT